MGKIDELLQEIEQLSLPDLERVKESILQREHSLQTSQRPRTSEEWEARINQFLDEFWNESSPEEMEQIIAAIRLKNKPTHKNT